MVITIANSIFNKKTMYSRILENTIKEKINSGKAIVIVGARQVGKTTLIKSILENKEYLFLVY